MSFIQVGRLLLNTRHIESIERTEAGTLKLWSACREPAIETDASFVDLVMRLENAGERCWLAMDGDGKKEPRPGEEREREWRAGADGLRPTEAVRSTLQEPVDGV